MTNSPSDPHLPLAGFAVANVESVGEEFARLGPLAKINFIVGRNNHGKSTLLRASQLFAASGADRDYVTRILPPISRSYGSSVRAKRELLVVLDSAYLPPEVGGAQGWQVSLRQVENTGLGVVRGDKALIWLKMSDSGFYLDEEHLDLEAWSRVLGRRPDRAHLASALLVGREGMSQGVVRPGAYEGPKWVHLPAFRKIAPFESDDKKNIGPRLDEGEGIVADLLDWQSPDTALRDYEIKEQKFARLQELLRVVLEDSDARIHIPANRRTIQIGTSQTGGRRVDIDALGDGIKQIVMLGAAALRYDHTLICIEEPELHLHPGIQRKLMAHIRDNTSNQYLIATHSAHILDTAGAAVFHVVHDGESTGVSERVSIDDAARIAEDLGYRASDLVQANFVLWVEGPADRIYWRRWISLVDPMLQEGVHYTVVSYGGSLVSDVQLGQAVPAAEGEPSEEALVDLLSLGRHCALVADSDKTEAGDDLRSSVKRLRSAAESLESANVIVLEHARTVENLLPTAVLANALRIVHPKMSARFVAPTTMFHGPFESLGESRPNKVAIARVATPMIDRGQIARDPDLETALATLVAQIRVANGLELAPQSRTL